MILWSRWYALSERIVVRDEQRVRRMRSTSFRAFRGCTSSAPPDATSLRLSFFGSGDNMSASWRQRFNRMDET